MTGALILDGSGKPIVADGGVLRTFQATTPQQYQDFRLFGTTNGATLLAQFGPNVSPGVYQDALSSAYANQQARLVTQNYDRQRLEQLSARNGAAAPVNVVEENLLLGMVAKGAGMAFNGVNSVLAPTGTNVFWSGGRLAEDAARAFAITKRGVVIGDTVKGRALASATEGVPWSQARLQWLELSEDFARSASGEVNVFQNSRGLSVDSIWRNEYQILLQNPNVTKINFSVVMPDGSIVRLP